MKKLSAILAALFLAAAFGARSAGETPAQREKLEGARPEAAAAFGSPEKTFETLLRAIRARDLELYKRCFSERGLQSEAMLDRAAKDAEGFWKELQGLFKGPQRLVVREEIPPAGRVRGRVEAPEAERGGIGTITFVREKDGWKIDRW